MAGDKFGTPYRIIDSIFYDKFGARALIAYGNGTQTQYDYEPYRRRLAGLQTFSGSSSLMDLTYSYDEENNITGISNSAFAVNGLGGNYSYNYEYDNMYRLVNAGGSFTDHQQKNYTFELAMSYSPSGNILSKNMDALTYQSGVGDVAVFYENTYAYNYSQPHAISQINGSGGGQDLHWDLNGNLTRHIRTEPDLDRRLCWDEENRLTAVRDQNHLSAYIYDAGGERVWKLTGQVQQMYVDGMGYVDVVDLNNKTLYASPYLVYNEQGYSKHYYAGAERVSSRIGWGMQDALVDPLNSALPHLSDHDNYNAITSDLYEMLMRAAECAGMTRKYVSMAHVFGIIYETTGWSNPEENWYIYHSDHLGSSSFLTDASGNPTQHLQYMPFGETFVEQRSVTSYYTPYTFSAKERDPETGYSYFGARYYSSDISVWLSVDPLADKYPSMSAYMYCAGNPVMLVDPDGRAFIVKISNLSVRENIHRYVNSKLESGAYYCKKSSKHNKALRTTYIQKSDESGNYYQLSFKNEKKANRAITNMEAQAEIFARSNETKSKATALLETVMLARSILTPEGSENDITIREVKGKNPAEDIVVNNRQIEVKEEAINELSGLYDKEHPDYDWIMIRRQALFNLSERIMKKVFDLVKNDIED
jgi:RHS repeat-associated protein